jgi:methylated-DNA-[protein]-cysteine S-methyltransferase
VAFNQIEGIDMISTTHCNTPLGRMLATAEDNALTGLYFIGQRYFPERTEGWREDGEARPFGALQRQLDEYFSGARLLFDVPLNPGGRRGTPFQRAVWDAIAAVPFGATATYSALAARCGRPSAARASGAATGRNPISLVIPCHRIMGSNGALTGYAGGLERKRALLAFERAVADGETGSIARFVAAAQRAKGLPASPPPQPELGQLR